MSERAYIYQVRDPKDGCVVYYGKTGRCWKKRWADHTYRFRNGIHANRQLMRLYNARSAQGYKPIKNELVAVVEDSDADRVERQLISLGRKRIGRRLCNVTDGGEGGKRNKEMRRRISDAVKDKWRDPEYRAKCEKYNRSDRHKHALRKAAARRAGFSSIDEWERDRDKKNREQRRQYKRRVAANKKLSVGVVTELTHRSSAFVPLTNGLWCRVPKHNLPFIKQYKWSASKHRGKYRPKTNSGGRSLIMPRPWTIINDKNVGIGSSPTPAMYG